MSLFEPAKVKIFKEKQQYLQSVGNLKGLM